jgi:hypothetical protein
VSEPTTVSATLIIRLGDGRTATFGVSVQSMRINRTLESWDTTNPRTLVEVALHGHEIEPATVSVSNKKGRRHGRH